jgi:hypothetical protein
LHFVLHNAAVTVATVLSHNDAFYNNVNFAVPLMTVVTVPLHIAYRANVFLVAAQHVHICCSLPTESTDKQVTPHYS